MTNCLMSNAEASPNDKRAEWKRTLHFRDLDLLIHSSFGASSFKVNAFA